MIQLDNLFQYYESEITKQTPVEWAEDNRYLTSEITSFPGLMSYDRFPYMKEIVNRISPDDPTRILTLMGGAQISKSTGFIETAIGYLIKNYPAPMILTSADKEQSKVQMAKKIDQMIANSGLGYLIRPNTLKKKNLKTGDTDDMKEFPGGSLMAMSIQAINKISKQNSFKYGFFDDFEAALDSPKNDGDIADLLMMRFNSFKDTMKVCFISTPRSKGNSLIEASFMDGDQRYFLMPCPDCGSLIRYTWTKKVEGKEDCYSGITFEKDTHGNLVENSVGFICPDCFNFFKETHKTEMLHNGIWSPSATPTRPDHLSYHISGLYSPMGFFDWSHHARQYLKIYPKDGTVKERSLQVFMNLVLGETYEETYKETNASQISRNVRNYEIGTVPDKLSREDGNEDIIILTMACDLNGFEDDARLDYEILAHALSGSTYSIDHGSIGTFQRGLAREGRELFTYYREGRNSVWDKIDEILLKEYKTESGGYLRIALAGIDTGFFTQFAYSYIDSHQSTVPVIGLKGDPDEKKRNTTADTPTFKESRERIGVYLVQTNQIKDMLSEHMRLKLQENQLQPSNFMNYPQSSEGKYDYRYFDEYEGEVRKPVLSENGAELAYIWEKKTSHSKNHFWDVRVYNLALREILVKRLGQAMKKKITWVELCRYVK